MYSWSALLILWLLLPSSVVANDLYSRILEVMRPGTITFIGETHQKTESIQLIQNLLSAISDRHECLTLALEIEDSQQPIIDQVIEGKASVSTIKIPSMIDHPALREFIAEQAKPDFQQQCLHLIAIDTGIKTEYDRDEWMAKKLSELPQDRPILVLLGNLHTLKRVNWTVSSGTPSVAEILDRKGFRIQSFPQHWSSESCTDHMQRTSRFIDAKEALNILNNELFSLLNATLHKSVDGVIDGVIVWECEVKNSLPGKV